MIQVIAGKKGSGKTKRLIDLTNATARDAIHDVIFLDDDNRYMYDVDHNVRFINAADYNVRSTEMFLGFVCGILSSNYDVGTIFVDAALRPRRQTECRFRPQRQRGSRRAARFPEAVPDLMTCFPAG